MKRSPRIRSRVALAAVAIASLLAITAAPAGAQEPPPPAQAADLTSTYQWTSTGPAILPQPTADHPVVAVKDPTVVRYNGQWIVYMTTADSNGAWGLASTTFSDWSQASTAPQQFLADNPNLAGWYTAAPQLFYFAPRDEWYLLYQTGPPSFSVSKNPADPMSWSAPKQMMDTGGKGLLDYWNICDDQMCYLFSADYDGRVYRAETTIGEFPNGFRNNKVVLQDPDPRRLFEGGAVYKVDGADRYLLIWEAGDADWTRYYRAFTSTSLDGPWQPLAAEESNPFASGANVSFPGGAWTEHISHGELIRSGYDQRMTIDPCNMQLLYQGHGQVPPDTPYSQMPYRLGLATQTNANCGGGTGTGQLVGAASGKCLDAPGQTDGTQAVIWDCNGGANQRWTLSSNGELSVTSGSSRKCLDVQGGGTANGTAAVLWACHGGSNQRWSLNGDGTIRSAQAGLCLDVSGWGTANGTKVHLWSCTGGANQQWSLR